VTRSGRLLHNVENKQRKRNQLIEKLQNAKRPKMVTEQNSENDNLDCSQDFTGTQEVEIETNPTNQG